MTRAIQRRKSEDVRGSGFYARPVSMDQSKRGQDGDSNGIRVDRRRSLLPVLVVEQAWHGQLLTGMWQ